MTASPTWVNVVGSYATHRRAGWKPRDAYRAACKEAGVSTGPSDRQQIRAVRERLRRG